MSSRRLLSKFLPSLPLLEWGQHYDKSQLASDLLAAVIVTFLLIPQSLAYAALANLPPQVGIYASTIPIVVYALLGSSRVLAVGPVAVVSLMTATAIAPAVKLGYAPEAAALVLALLSGGFLLLMGLFRFGFLANFLSHPVLSAFISASALLIAVSQLKVLFGVPAHGDSFFELAGSLVSQLPQTHTLSLSIGVTALLLLFLIRTRLKFLLISLRMSPRWADAIAKAFPVLIILSTTALTWFYGWHTMGVKIVGAIAGGLPPLALPPLDVALWRLLWAPALLISLVGFVESISVAQTLAAKRRQRIMPNQELVALGASNISSALSGGMPVTGGFARSIVNFEAGATTPAAGIFSAGGLLLASLWLTPYLYFLPQVTLAATILVAVLSLIDWKILRSTWHYSRADFGAVVTTLVLTLTLGIEAGLVGGVLVSLLLFLYHTSSPHIAEIGRVPNTEHFRNVLRHRVETHSHVLSFRVDESLYFANARTLEDYVNRMCADRPKLRHVVLNCSAINAIDASALDSLETIEHRLFNSGMTLHLSEVKGPVMDKLSKTLFIKHFKGQVFLTQFQAELALKESDSE